MWSGLILPAIVGAVVSGIIGWTARRVVSAAREVSAASRTITLTSAQLQHLVAVLGLPDAGDEQTPFIPYVHDAVHVLNNSVAKIVLSTDQLVKVSERASTAMGQAAGKLERLT